MNTIELKISRKELQELRQADITGDDFLDTLLKKLIFGEMTSCPFTIIYYPARYPDEKMVSATLQVGNTPDFGTTIESIKHIGDMVDGKMVCRKDCPSVTHRNTPEEVQRGKEYSQVEITEYSNGEIRANGIPVTTPDTEGCEECEQYGEIRPCSVHKIKAMNCRVKPSDPVFFDTNTPDTELEWVEDFIKEYSINLVDIKLPKELARRKLNQLLSSRDTYWKERIEKLEKSAELEKDWAVHDATSKLQ